MKTYQFYVSGTLFTEVEAENDLDAMDKANQLGLPYGFYGWMNAGDSAFSAMFGAWD